MKNLILLLIALVISSWSMAQTPQGFNYQAVARDRNGNPITEQNLTVRIGILQHEKLIWQEEQKVTTNGLGLFTLIIGDPETGGIGAAGSFENIPWEEGMISLKVDIDDGNGFTDFIPQPVNAVPYALHAPNRTGWSKEGETVFTSSFVEINTSNKQVEIPLFEVKNNLGNPVFAVYNDGVMVYVDESRKGVKGGFAVGGYSSITKSVTREYLRVRPDSTLINFNSDEIKGVKGGFAIGGYSGSAKEPAQQFLQVNRANTHVYFDESAAPKGVKGGFAVGGYSGTKQDADQLMSLTPENYLIGHEAGVSITSGRFNSFIGYQAGRNNTEGHHNLFLGYEAGLNNIGPVVAADQGSYNTFLGYQAGHGNTSGFRNVILGHQAGYNSNVSNNVIIGDEAGYNAQTGHGNVFIGQRAGHYNGISGTGASRNTFVGRHAGEKNDMGDSNTFLGAYAGSMAVNGRYNTFLGDGACEDGVPGDGNVYVGYRAGLNNDGQHNVVIGREAGSMENNHSLTSSYNNNVMVGYRAGFSNNTGHRNVFLGNYAGYNETGSDKLYIDNSTTSTPLIYGDFNSNNITINGRLGVNGVLPGTTYELDVNGEIRCTSVLQTSDARYKTIIQPIDNPLNKVMQLSGIYFIWNREAFPHRAFDSERQIGLIAQEVEKVIPEVVSYDDEGYGSIDYSKTVAVLIEAIKEQQQQIEALKQRIVELEK